MNSLGVNRSLAIEFCVVAMIVLICCLGTYKRNLVWKTETSLWADVVQKSPGKARPLNNLGRSYLRNKQCKQAIACLQKALSFQPMFIEAHYNLGMAYQIARQYRKAIVHYDKVLSVTQYLCASRDETSVNFYLGELHNNLGVCYFAVGSVETAIREFRKAVEFAPGHVNALYNLAMAGKWIKGAEEPN